MSRLFGFGGDATPFHDKAWRRADMAAWDARWRTLSRDARLFVLDRLKTGQYHHVARPINSPDEASGPVYAELLGEHFIDRHLDGYVVTEKAVGFVNRVRSLRRYGLLDATQPSQFDRYVGQTFLTFDLGNVVATIAEKQSGLDRYRVSGDVLDLFVRRHFWPEWVADHLNDHLVRPLLAAVEAHAVGPVPLADLASLLPNQHPSAVRAAYDRLVNHLVLFEDVTADGDLVAGLLPAVLADRRRRRSIQPPTLAPIELAETTNEAGFEVPDLRAVLLEISADRPRLKQDGSPYAREKERFLAAFDPWPKWVLPDDDALERRLTQALRWALRLEFVQTVKGPDDTVLMDLTANGRRWMTTDREGQHQELFADVRAPRSRMYPYAVHDAPFLGTTLFAARGKALRLPAMINPEDRHALREAVYKLFAELPVGTFFDLTTFFRWTSDPARNPLLLGRTARDVCVRDEHQVIPPLDDHLEEAGRDLVQALFSGRLVGLGCVQMGRDAAGRPLFARLPRLDGYFGREVKRIEAAETATRVIVQPDFTVIVIGTDPGPPASLAPFCDRVQGSAGQGALTYRLSRESVFRAIGGGMKPDEIAGRLNRHASTAVPANVATELQTWCGQARTVSVGSATVIRCPDAETAGRVCAALGKIAERLGDVAVAIEGRLTPALRQRLQAQGVMIGVADPAEKKRR